MLYWLMNVWLPWLEQVGTRAAGDSSTFITTRLAAAAITSFLLCVLTGPLAIRWLQQRAGERIGSDSAELNRLHAQKAKTPTMGGLFMFGSLIAAVLLWCDLSQAFVQMSLASVLGFGLLGAIDDWIKLRTARNGLAARTKIRVQWALAATLGLWLLTTFGKLGVSSAIVWPIGGTTIALGWLFIPWSMLVLVGSSNGVNLTDGLDGLAAGCGIFTSSALAGVLYVAGHVVFADYFALPAVPGSGEMAIVMAALVGSLLGFLWFNCYPAQVFMGDTGSQPLGALLGLAALVARQEVLLLLLGGIFVVETLSVMLQVASFKLTGKRVLACSPLHNHFVFRGHHELKIVTRFWIGSALLAVVGLASLKIY